MIVLAALLGWVCPPACAASGGQLVLTVVDQKTKRPISCRLHLYKGVKQQVRRVKGFPFWEDHMAIPGNIKLRLPNGIYYFEIERGLEYLHQRGHFKIENFADDVKTVELRRFVDMSENGWWSGDFEVRRPVKDIELVMSADDLHVAMLLPDARTRRRAASSKKARSKSSKNTEAATMPVRFDKDRFYSTDVFETVWPGTTLYCFNGNKALGDLKLDAGRLLNEEQLPLERLKTLHGDSEGWVDVSRPYWWDLPVLVAEGLVNSVEVAHSGFGRKVVVGTEKPGRVRPRDLYPGKEGLPRWTQDIYFKLVDAGFRIPPSAGSGTGQAPNPIGYNRMYVHVDGPMSYEKWWAGLRAGRVTVTNGPLLRPSVEGHPPGYTFQGPEGEPIELQIDLTLSTRDKISYLEIIKNGKAEQIIPLAEYAKTGRLPKLRFEESGWFLVRAVCDLEKNYRFAMTAPYYVQIGYKQRVSRKSVQFFVDWIDERIEQLQSEGKPEDLEVYQRAKKFWEDLAKKATAD
ncbi:MAG: hypothetical protein PVH19_07990 [Planctomycetia bacterium]